MTNNLTSTDAVAATEESKERQYWVEMNDALTRLHSNPDFQKVILDGYFKEFVINQTSMLATDYVRKMQIRPTIMEQLVAVSHLQDHFNTIRQLGELSAFDDEDENEDESGE